MEIRLHSTICFLEQRLSKRNDNFPFSQALNLPQICFAAEDWFATHRVTDKVDALTKTNDKCEIYRESIAEIALFLGRDFVYSFRSLPTPPII
jgi:hypothetical protein